MKILFYAPILEYPAVGGPQLSVLNAIKVLNEIGDLHIFTTVPRKNINDAEASEFFSGRCCTLTHAYTSFWSSRNRTLGMILRRTRRLFKLIFALIDVFCLIRLGNKHKVDVFWIDRVVEHSFFVFWILRIFKPKATIVGDTEAVHSRFVHRELPMMQRSTRKFYIWIKGNVAMLQEKLLVRLADVVTAVSEVDMEYFDQLPNCRAKVMKFSNVVDLADYKPGSEEIPSANIPCALLIGSFGHVNSPMDRAAKWLVEGIMPIVWETNPDLHLYIIGRNSHHCLSHISSSKVTVVGEVPSMAPWLHAATMTLVPLKFESGTRFKIIESGAAKVACVSTSLGAEGLDVVDGHSIAIADEAIDFAQSICLLANSDALRRRYANNLHNLIVDRYSLETQVKEGRSILETLTLN